MIISLCVCRTYANIAACYNACPDLDQGATYKQESDQHCTEAHVSPKASLYNITSPPVPSPVAATPTQTPTSGTGTTTVTPVASASAFARSSSTANPKFELSSGVVGLAVGLCTMLFA